MTEGSSTILRLGRYTKKTLAERNDPDFADAVFEAIEGLQNLNHEIFVRDVKLGKMAAELENCRNALCLKCGNFREAHLGSCDGCRWHADEKKAEMPKEKTSVWLFGDHNCVCDRCGAYSETDSPYCPSCGARMVN